MRECIFKIPRVTCLPVFQIFYLIPLAGEGGREEGREEKKKAKETETYSLKL